MSRRIVLLIASLVVLTTLMPAGAAARRARPANLTLPTVAGPPQSGATLDAGNGTWSGSPTGYAYQWKSCDSTGARCVNITGATSQSVVVSSSQVGRTISVGVTATNAAGSTTARSALTKTITTSVTPPTTPTSFAVTGSTQTTVSTSWASSTGGAGVAGYAVAVDGASAGTTTGTSYTFGNLGCGTSYALAVSAYDAAGNTSQASTLTASTAACTAAPATTAAPGVSGSAQVGQALATSNGSWSGSTPMTYAYQWQDCDSAGANCANISGATGSAYMLAAGDQGHTVRAKVTASNAAGTATATSAQSGVVAAASARPFVSVAFDVACDRAASTPWNGITQDILFTLQTTNGSALDTTGQCMNQLNVPQWVATVHANHRLALIAIGGIADQNWENACNNTNRSAFVTNLVNYMVSNGFDGVDLDIEDDFWAAQLPPVAAWDACVQAIANAAHAATTTAGARPIVTEDVTTPWMGSWLRNVVPYVDQFNLMTYGDSCANSCADFASDIQQTLNQGIPKAKMVLGIDLIDATPQHANQTLGSTRSALSTAGAIGSIPVAALAAAIPAGNVVLATGENPAAHYQVFTTSGAAAGATSIPVTSATPNFAYPSGSLLQSAYAGSWDCRNVADYAVASGLMGVMVWDVHEDAVQHNGRFPCFDQIDPFVP